MPGLIEDPLGLDGLGGSSVKKTASPPKEDDTLRQPAITEVDAVPHKELIRAIRTDWRWHSTAALLCADALEAADKQLADWTRRSESCESRLGQLEANEKLIDERAHIKQLERGFDKQAKRITELEAENDHLHLREEKFMAEIAQVSQIQRERDEAVSAVQRFSAGQPFDAVVIADTAKRIAGDELLSAQVTIKRMRESLEQAIAAILLFRNEPMLGRLIKLRGTEGYAAMERALDRGCVVLDLPADTSAPRRDDP